MIPRLVSSRLPVLAYHPPKVCDAAYMQALDRAGVLPILDSEFLTNTEIIQTLDRLSGMDLLFGLRLSVTNQALVDYLDRNPVANLELIVFTYRTQDELKSFTFDNRDDKFVLEIVDIKLDREIERIAPHGLIVKGMEAPGRVSRNSAFIILQWYLENLDLPVFVHGGVGRHTAAGLFAMGAHGVVLDNQLYLAEEAPLDASYKDLLRGLEEKDSTIVGHSLRAGYRFFAKLGTRIVKTLRDQEIQLAGVDDADEMLYREIEKGFTRLDETSDAPVQSLFYLGQDAVFARHFAAMGSDVATIIRELFGHIGQQLAAVDEHDPLKAGAALAREHGTRYPVIQGPMANVSDNADFGAAVFANGGLPFFALGNLPADLADDILKNGKEKVARFGAGMIGIEAFNQTIAHHLASVKKYAVPFALFAGGIPSQVKELEASGTKTYLHTPSLSMLDNAIDKGCTRFIFEGSEAGGHVGELSSLVLWEQAMEKMSRLPEDQRRDKTLIFAGGIGTRRASQFVSGMTAGMASQGVKIGIQVGTSYLFTQEIVDTGAIKKLYQDVVCERDETILMGQTVGLASRTVATPFSQRMIENEHRRMREGQPLNDRKKAFEKDNIGSLLIGAKAFCPDFDSASGEVCLIDYEEKEQFECGNFMVGDCLTFNPCTTTIATVHTSFFEGKEELAARLNALEIFSSPVKEIEDEIAVIGMGCIYPDAHDPAKLWENVVARHYAIGEMPAERLDPSLYYDEDRKAQDKSYTKIAGLVNDFTFDHERYGYTPEKAARLSRSQQMVLESAYRAVADAGYLQDDLKLDPRLVASTAVVVATCLGNELGNDLHLKYWYPELRHHLNQIEAFNTLDEAARTRLLETLRDGMANGLDYEPVHGQLLNIEASRIAHHMGIEGINYVVDAACATSFAALDCSIKELLSGTYDMVITGGVNTNLAPESFVGFSKMGALSATGSYPFDERADGFVLGEGAGVLVLKRMKDALRDGDRIHAVIKGVGASSDGKGKAIAAPNTRGQALALNRCYEKIRDDVSVADIDYIEAHGTSTIAGDGAEIDTLKQVYGGGQAIGISSIKSQIGHLLGGAGYAGLIKAILAIQNKTLPPNGQFEKAAAAHGFEDTPLYVIDEPRPWEKADGRPRMAAVSSYGFGGINYHCVVAEHTPGYTPLPRRIFADPDYDFNQDRIVFAGLGVVLPESPDVETFWQNLETGRTVFSAIPEERFHNASYAEEPQDSNYRIPMVKAGVVKDYRFNNVRFRIPPSTARSLDRAQLFALDAANQAIEAAGLAPLLTPGNRTAVILGTLPGERQVKNILRVRLGKIERILTTIEGLDPAVREAIAARLLDRLSDRLPENNEDTIPGLLSNIVSGRVANTFGCNGANYVVDASCASSTVATRLAVRGLQSGDYDTVLTGGVDANFYPTVMLAFKRLSLLSDGDCRFFDKHANGYVMSEGAAIQVVTTYRYAKKHNLPILGEFGHTAFKSSVPEHLLAPSEKKYGEAVDACYRHLPITKQQIAHLDVFGVSNFFLDLMEKQALEARMPAGTFFGNIKSEFGYFKSANPAVVLTKLLLMNRKKTILPNYSYSADSSIVARDARLKANPRLLRLENRRSLYFAANVNGVGGNHGHTVIGTLPAWLENATQPAQAAATQTAAALSPTAPRPLPAGDGGMVALISGQGAQYSGMMKPLYDAVPEIRGVLDGGERIFREMRGYSLLDIMFGESRQLNLTENTQPAVFLSSAALFGYLEARGLAPDVFIGHSVGEYGALFCAGLLDFETAMRLIVKRADFMKAATEEQPGRIMVVFKDAEAVHELIRASKVRNIYVANKNSVKQTGVSGAAADIDRFCDYLKDAKVMFKKLALSGAFHTPLFNRAAEQMENYLEEVTFNPVNFGRVISNVTADPYPDDAAAVKKLLVRQIVSPVEFIASVTHARQAGYDRFYEIGPGRILVNLLKNIPIEDFTAQPTIDAKQGEVESLEKMVARLQADDRNEAPAAGSAPAKPPASAPESLPAAPATVDEPLAAGADFEDFMARNEKALREMAFREFQKQKREQALRDVERFNFYTGKAVVAGVSIGLPGSGNKVFNANNFEKLLNGNNFIEPLSPDEKKKIVDMNITRVFKQPDGNARFLDITDTRDVIQLAGKLGYFNLKNEYGVDYDYDVTIALAIAAGIEALKDAHIPMVLQHKETSTGNRIPNGYALPAEMQETTGVIMTSLFPGFETLIEQLNKYYYNKFYVRPYKELENIYYHLMESVRDPEIKEQITDWFFKIKERRKKYGTYKFERNLLFDVVPLGSAHFAQLIKAKGPNMMMSGACASTTQAVGVAEDWIRTGRCDRVIIVGGEASTSETQSPWIASGFLALGAASIKEVVTDAAKPFDEERNGTILGAGAVSLIIEREDRTRERGLNGQAEILGTYIGNSAFHATQIDQKHLTAEMARFVRRVESHHQIDPAEYTRSMVFMSHETFTPARGGSASAEVGSLKQTYPEHYRNITITNTKGFTGHTLGAAIEDAVMIKALQEGRVPPIANLSRVPDEFGDLNFSCGENGCGYEYGLHYAAGFGSHFAFLMVKRIAESQAEDNPVYRNWLRRISGLKRPQLKVIDNTLCIDPHVISEVEAPPAVTVDAPAAPPADAPPTQRGVPAVKAAAPPAADFLTMVKTIIAEQTGYTVDMLEDELDLEADLGIDTVKQVEIFGKVSAHFGLDVPEDLRLNDLNTIAKIGDYLSQRAAAPPAPAGDTVTDSAPVPTAADTADHLAAVKTIIAEQTGYTADMLEDELDLEADLGIDTVKQVEIFGKVSAHFGLDVPEDLRLNDLNTIAKIGEYLNERVTPVASPTAAPTAAASAAVTADTAPDLLGAVKDIIAEQTGYTVDMLEDELDLEADLGIDTVKQVEIFGKVSVHFGLDVPEDLRLNDLNTITKIGDYLSQRVAAPPAPAGDTVTDSAPVPTAADTADHLAAVKTIIAEQTGYTADMLEDELDLEADLGIDTVKQVEIFGKVSAHFGLDVPEDLRLNDLNTIAKIGQYLAARVTEAPAEAAPAPPVAEAEARSAEKNEAEGPVKRMVVRAVPSDVSIGRPGWFKDRRVLMTADRHGFAALMAERITADGGTPVIVGDTDAAELRCDWSTPAAVKTLVKEIDGQYLPIDGIVHLTPLDGAFETARISPTTIERRLKQFFTLVQGLFDRLARPETFVAMPAFNGAVLPYGESAGPIDAVAAGLAGMLKTINKELPDTLVKVVDFDAAMVAEPQAVVDTFLAELTGGDRRVECGYRGGERWVLQLDPDGPETSGSLVVADDTVMVTGGARGITFEILKSLVAAHPVRLEILGRSDVDGLDPALADAAVSEADLMTRLKADMQGAKPLEIKKALDRVVKLRESAANLNTLRSMGARVTYHAVDVSDAGAVERVVRSVGGVDVLIHAAGIEESRMIPKKTRASFDRVFDTKVAGLMNILAALDHEAPRSLMTFSSVTARFGNEGQVDYTAANDMIAKMLLEYGRQHLKTAVKIFDWTAWEGAGMATNETVNKVLRERGLTFLPLAHGVSLFMRELGDAKTPEVVFSGLDHAFDPDGLMRADQADMRMAPFLDACVEAEDRRRVYGRVLDLERDLFLLDHAREDVPIFLGATGIEAMAEAAATLATPGMHLRTLRDFSIPYGIKILKQRPKQILIEAAAAAEDADTFLCRISSQFRNKQGIAMGEPKLHYQGTYSFGPAEATLPTVTLPAFQPVEYEGDIQELLYHPSRLFMDGLFRTVEDIVSFEEDRLISRIRSTSTRPFFADDPRPSFLTDVAVVDAMFQTGGMLEVMTTNIIVLPYTIGRMHFHRPLVPGGEYLCVTERVSQGRDTNTYRLQLVDAQGRGHITIEDFEMVQVDQLSAADQIVDRLKTGRHRQRAS